MAGHKVKASFPKGWWREMLPGGLVGHVVVSVCQDFCLKKREFPY